MADNLGIGTTTPLHSLHIAKDAPASAALGTAPAVLMLEQANNTGWSDGQAGGEILFKKGGDIVGAIRSIHTRTGGIHSNEDAGLSFWVAPSAETPTAYEAMRITYQGRVGIGTTDPEEKLDVEGNIYGWNMPKDVKVTTATHNGNFGSYQAMYNWIQTNGCSGYHVCDGIELTRYYQTHATGTLTGWINLPARYNVDGYDCVGWSSSGTDGYLWCSSRVCGGSACGTAYQVMCCK